MNLTSDQKKGPANPADFASKIADMDEVLNGPMDVNKKSLFPPQDDSEQEEEEEEEEKEEGEQSFNAPFREDEGDIDPEINDISNNSGNNSSPPPQVGSEGEGDNPDGFNFNSQQKNLDDYNTWWRKQQELPGAAQIPQIELGGLGAVSPTKGTRNPYEGSPIANVNDISGVSESSTVEIQLQEKISSMQDVIDQQRQEMEMQREEMQKMAKTVEEVVKNSPVKTGGEGGEKTPTSIRRKSRFAFDGPAGVGAGVGGAWRREAKRRDGNAIFEFVI